LNSDFWNLKEPHLILSVIGSYKEVNNKTARIRNAFKRGLMKVANTKSAWIITNGVDTGVSRLVSEAVSDEKNSVNSNLILIGICQWGKVALRETLIVSII
jgi:hypothetical protein